MDQDFIPEWVSGWQLDELTASWHQTPQRRPGHATSPSRTNEGRTPGHSTVKRQPVKTEPLQEELLRAQKTNQARSISCEGYNGLETLEEDMEDKKLEMSIQEKDMLDSYRIRNDNNCSKAVKIAHNLARRALGIIYERDDFVWTDEYIEKYLDQLKKAREMLVENAEERCQSCQSSRTTS
ncbi:hypothetical protein BD779DRAFT_1685532 [Infundibulicybe gibba]|nr:hypothetical protein BD779DRAFT_1685532 [Infundibulicybe gibba]